MIVTPLDLKGIINITQVKNSTCYFNRQLLLTDCFLVRSSFKEDSSITYVYTYVSIVYVYISYVLSF